jgi:UDP:flavonoid glycosyltransferase YjiC (YdhE family)
MTTTGTLGDVHPYVAVSIGLRQRGHEVTIATSEFYRTKIESEGIGFHPLRPDLGAIYRDSDVMRRAVDPSTGTEFVLRQLLLPHLEESYEDLLQACRSKDLLVGHTAGTYALPLVAEKLRIPWVSIALQPLIFFSIYDPPVLPSTTEPYRFYGLSDWEYMLLFWSIKRRTRAWMEPVDHLRSRLGLAPAAGHPMFEGVFSPYGTLAWFSALMGSQQQDWPKPTRITGFPFHDRQEAGKGLDSRLFEFLEKGEPPIIFTLGASTVLDSGDFFEQSISAARRLGCRAVLLMGAQGPSREWNSLPDTMLAVDYAPYSALLPLAAVTVHHGGIGTTAQALRAGRPMLVVPYSNDQPDNAERVARLGVARVVYPRLYTAKRAQAELTRLLSDSSYSERAAEFGQQIRAEEGVANACDAIEELAAAA